MKLKKSGVLWLSLCLVGCVVGVGAALETGWYSYYVLAAACLCFGFSAYQHPPLRVFANEPQLPARRADVISVVGLLLFAFFLVLRYVVPAA